MINDTTTAGTWGQRPAARRTKPDPLRSGTSPQFFSRRLKALLVRLAFAATLVAVVAVWLHGGGITAVTGFAGLLTSAGRLAGLLGAYALLVQFLFLARAPFMEWVAGFDQVTKWHKINGKLTLGLILGHVGLITAGYALMGRVSFLTQFLVFLHSYPGMVAALAGTLLLMLVVVTSVAIARRRMGYQAWFLVHLMAYSALALTWFHQIPTGQVFLANPLAGAFWTALYVVTLEIVVLFRFGQPILRNLWYRLRVAEVTREAPGVVSLHITGHHLDALRARAGQYFFWRFLDWDRWQESHPFSLSAAPDGHSLRITVKALGDFSEQLAAIKPGTRAVIEGPFGTFTDEARSRDRVALIAGGVGITPIRALVEEMPADLVLIYRAHRNEDLIFRAELDSLTRERRGLKIHYVVGERGAPGNGHLLSTEHLMQLVPDIARREVYLCGPEGMMRSVRVSVTRAGVPARHIHQDQFAF